MTSFQKIQIIFKILFIFFILVIGGFAIFLVTHHKYLDIGVKWIQERGLIGYIVIILCDILSAFPFATGYTELALASGFIYGIPIGLSITFTGGIFLGSAISFLFCFKLLKSWIEKKVNEHKKLSALLKVLRTNAFKITLLCRLTPIPFGLQNAVFAISGMPFERYWFATWIGMLPEAILWVYFGSTAKNLESLFSANNSKHFSKTQIILFSVELSAAIILTIILIIIGRRAIKKAIADQEKEESLSLLDDEQQQNNNFENNNFNSSNLIIN